MHRPVKLLHIWLRATRYPCVLACFGKRRTGCSACCDWKSLHGAGGIGQKNQLAPCHASGRNRHNSLGLSLPRNLSSRRLANPDTMPIPLWRMVGCTTSQRRSCFRQKNCGRRDQFHVGIYSEVLVFCSTVMTTFPWACPSSRYRIASAVSRNG